MGELETAKTNLAKVLKLILTSNGGAGGANAELMRAQAMQAQRRAAELAAANPAYRTASPQQQQLYQQQLQQQLNPSLASTSLRASPSLGPVGSNAGSPVDGSPDAQGLKAKKMVKKVDTTGMTPQQQQLAMEQAQIQAQVAQAQPAQAGVPYPPAAPAAVPYTSMMGSSAPLYIPSSLSLAPAVPESFAAPRPTLSSGLANSPVVSTPAITKFNPGAAMSSFGSPGLGRKDGGAAAKRERDTREDSKGRTVSKRKIRELVESVDEEERLNDDVEDVSTLSCDGTC